MSVDFAEEIKDQNVVLLEDGRAAIRTVIVRGVAGKGPKGEQIEYLAFGDPKEGLRIAYDLGLTCMRLIGKDKSAP
tara:strand:- start:66914 stop:67141 length:228 start_codon:yes stop_codon:yes gene_type:complete